MTRLLTLLMMITLMIVSGTSLAAAMCQHRDAVEHAALLHGDNREAAAVAQLEEAAGSVASKQGRLVDAGAFSLPAVILPSSSLALASPADLRAHLRPVNAAKMTGRSIRPLLEPPAA